jgi:copper chaperone CopZ
METRYAIAGMTCHHCVAHILEEARLIPGVTDADLTLEGAVLTLVSDAPVDFAQVQAAVAEAGDDYTVAAI